MASRLIAKPSSIRAFRRPLARPVWRSSTVRPLVPPTRSRLPSRCFSTQPYEDEFRELDESGNAAPPPPPPARLPTDNPIVEVNQRNFEAIVMDSQLPVLLDCYTPQTAEQTAEYTDSLMKLVRDEHGYMILARLNLQANMALAQDLRVEKVPTLICIIGGRVINQVSGMATQDSLRKIVDAVMGMAFADESSPLIDAADVMLADGDITVLETKRYHMEPLALSGLAQCAIKEGNLDTARHLVNIIQERHTPLVRHPRIRQVVSELEMAEGGGSQENEQELLSNIEKNAKDWESRFSLGRTYAAQGRHNDAMTQMFEIIKGDKEWNNQAAKTFLLKMFDSLGEDNELATKGRKRLNNLWYL